MSDQNKHSAKQINKSILLFFYFDILYIQFMSSVNWAGNEFGKFVSVWMITRNFDQGLQLLRSTNWIKVPMWGATRVQYICRPGADADQDADARFTTPDLLRVSIYLWQLLLLYLLSPPRHTDEETRKQRCSNPQYYSTVLYLIAQLTR